MAQIYNVVSNANRSKLICIMKRIAFVIVCLLFKIQLIAQTQYDYYDDGAVAGGADRALNGIVFIIGLVVVAVVLIFVIGGALKVYEWFNPKANPEYKRNLVKQEQAKKLEEYEKEQRQKASPIAVDLGLSVKWASFNVGAYKPSDIGDRFYWAENTPSKVGSPMFSKIDVNTIGDISGDDRYDAATKMYGKKWRTPTTKECQELINLCKWEIKQIDGVEGRIIIGPTGNSIFLPYNQKSIITGKYVSGHYWTSEPHIGWSKSSDDLRFGENCKIPAEVWCSSASMCLYCIRPVLISSINKELENRNDE